MTNLEALEEKGARAGVSRRSTWRMRIPKLISVELKHPAPDFQWCLQVMGEA